jgi:hypothetical protein
MGSPSLVVGCVVVLTMLMASAGRAGEPEGPLAYYPFSGDANDMSGNGHDGAVYGPVLTTDRFGAADSAYYFDGIDDYINVPYAPEFNSQALTITAWICPSIDLSVGDSSAIIAARGEDFANDLLSWSLEVSGTSDQWGTGAKLLYEDAGDTERVYCTGLFPEPGTWSQIATARSLDDEIALYIDGVLVGNWSGTPDLATCAQDLTIGARWSSQALSGPYHIGGFFPGSLDDISFYDRALTAEEIANMLPWTLTVSATGGGWVTVPGEGTFHYAIGVSVPVVAVAEAHYNFTHWTGTAVDAGKVANPSSVSTDVTMDGNYTLQANFAIDQHSLTTSSTAGGTVSSPGIGSFSYDYGSPASISATANPHHHFTGWAGTAVTAGKVVNPAEASTTVTMEGDYTLQATFAIDRHTLAVTSMGHGSVSAPGMGTFTYDYGSNVAIGATAEAHYHFTSWTGSAAMAGKVADPAGANTTVLVDADYTLQAGFAIDQHTLTISSTAGGTVNDPGIGTFQYDYGQQITLEAQAKPGFAFTHWSGSYFGILSPAYFSVEADHHMRAHFLSFLDTIYVDADAPDDPEPNDLTGSDPNEDGTAEHPFDSIQEAIEVAAEGATVIVRPGTYWENIDFMGKSITVTGLGPVGTTLTPEFPTVQGLSDRPVVTFSQGEDPSAVLSGFVVTGGCGDRAGGIFCRRSHPTIVNCLIVGNRSTGRPGGGGISCNDSNPLLSNCTIADNVSCGSDGAGLYCTDSHPVIQNCILWGNLPTEVAYDDSSLPLFSYADVSGGQPGEGNLNTDPLFVSPGYWANPWDGKPTADPSYAGAIWVGGNYHLHSDSPCIDAGDPSVPVGQEPSPNGGLVNLGVYGGTNQASISADSD